MSVGGDSARVPVSRRAVVAGALATCVSLVGCGCSPGQGDGGAVMIWDAMGVSKDDPITDEQLAVAHVVCREEDALHVYDELVRTRRWPERLYGHLFERTMAGCFLAERMAEHYGATFTVTGGPHYGDVALFPGEPSYLGYEFDVQDDPRGVSSCSATLHFEEYLQYEGVSISDSYFSIARTPEMRSFCWDALRADYRAAAEAHGVSEQAYGAVRANCRNEETGWTYDVDAPIEELTPCYAVNLGVYFDGRPPAEPPDEAAYRATFDATLEALGSRGFDDVSLVFAVVIADNPSWEGSHEMSGDYGEAAEYASTEEGPLVKWVIEASTRNLEYEGDRQRGEA